MSQLEAKFDKELHRDGHVVACRFPLPTWNPVKIYGEGLDTVWVYKHPSNTDFTRIAKSMIDSETLEFGNSDTQTTNSEQSRTSRLKIDDQNIVKDSIKSFKEER